MSTISRNSDKAYQSMQNNFNVEVDRRTQARQQLMHELERYNADKALHNKEAALKKKKNSKSKQLRKEEIEKEIAQNKQNRKAKRNTEKRNYE